MRPPLIGITTYHRDRLDDADPRYRFWLPAAYVDAVRGAGGLPVLLAPGASGAAETAERLDGLVLAGGGDIHPERYEGVGHETTYFVNEERDAFEIALLGAALERDLPTLAICRGLQLLNVSLGGGLHGHLPDLGIAEKVHRASRFEHTFHPVSLERSSFLGRTLAAGEFEVASWHHQAVAQLGRGLRAVAWAPDGTVEAIEVEGQENLLAVQWHPELQIEPGSLQWKLFEAFIALAQKAQTEE